MEWSKLNELTAMHGDSFFVFDKATFVENFQRLNSAFNGVYPNSRIGYSYKTNYTPTICRLVQEMGGFAEIVSEMEFELAERLGVPYDRIIYNGPYKSERSLQKALLNGTIVNLDSERDLNILLRLAAINQGIKFEISIRCNFVIDEEMVSRFGFDVDSDLFDSSIQKISNTSNISLAGLHCHFPNRALDTYRTRVNRMIQLIRKYFSSPPKFINIGGGFFGKVPESLWNSFAVGSPPSFKDYADIVGGALRREFPDDATAPVLFLEPGTALVANTFRFYSKIIDVKKVRGRNIATASGSIFNISPTARNENLPLTMISDPKIEEPDACNVFDIGGFTCIEGDYLSRNVKHCIKVGDYAEYQNVGSYSIVMKPPFILPNVPILMLENGQDDFKVIKKRETTEYIFENFVD